VKLFIAGICGTFMAGVAQLAQALGHTVSGCDADVYPPMSEVLAAAGIKVKSGYLPTHIDHDCDCVLIGNALSRGNPLVEHVLANRLPYTSGPEWLGRHVLTDRTVISVAGTHGKTSTSSMIAWILESAGLEPGFLIGGKPGNFDRSARLGGGELFVIEADEYDTAFFDKRSKFVHYRTDIGVLNNLEFDHADIFDDLGQIQRQFHHLVRTIPGNGHIISNAGDASLDAVLDMGCWTPLSTFSTSSAPANWSATILDNDASGFDVIHDTYRVGTVRWSCIGVHNMQNGIAAIAATSEVGVAPSDACAALAGFVAGARRLQQRLNSARVTLYEDFAHHPTAIRMTLEGLRLAHPNSYLLAIIEPRSNTMRMSVHAGQIGSAIASADEALFYVPAKLDWDPATLDSNCAVSVAGSADQIVTRVTAPADRHTVIVAMSNGSFDGIPGRLQSKFSQIG